MTRHRVGGRGVVLLPISAPARGIADSSTSSAGQHAKPRPTGCRKLKYRSRTATVDDQRLTATVERHCWSPPWTSYSAPTRINPACPSTSSANATVPSSTLRLGQRHRYRTTVSAWCRFPKPRRAHGHHRGTSERAQRPNDAVPFITKCFSAPVESVGPPRWSGLCGDSGSAAVWPARGVGSRVLVIIVLFVVLLVARAWRRCYAVAGQADGAGRISRLSGGCARWGAVR
jgi:hypothetical protein